MKIPAETHIVCAMKFFNPVTFLLLALCCPYLMASCLDNLPRETPSDDFIIDNAVVTHKKTGLMWARCSLGYSWSSTTANCDYDLQTKKALFTWPEALQQAELFSLAGKQDWRLPNKNELMSIADHACTGPAINEIIFPNTTAASYWSSSPYGTELENVWRVIFTTGDLLNASVSSSLYVRLVREP